MGIPVPYYLSDPDYYARSDPRRAAHLAHIETQRRINARIDASAGDGSYAVIVTKKDVVR
jgi:hypothetical protein